MVSTFTTLLFAYGALAAVVKPMNPQARGLVASQTTSTTAAAPTPGVDYDRPFVLHEGGSLIIAHNGTMISVGPDDHVIDSIAMPPEEFLALTGCPLTANETANALCMEGTGVGAATPDQPGVSPNKRDTIFEKRLACASVQCPNFATCTTNSLLTEKCASCIKTVDRVTGDTAAFGTCRNYVPPFLSTLAYIALTS